MLKGERRKPWPESAANRWYDGLGFIFGFNYVTSTAVNATQMWQKETFDPANIQRELKMGAETGYNSCRVFLPFIVWENDAEGFLERFDEFLAIADDCGLSVMPILFDDCAFAGKEPYIGPQDPPVKGVTNSGWTSSPGFHKADDPSYLPALEAYVTAVMTAHKDDRRIIVWDLYNEPGNSERGDKCIPLLKNVFTWARACRVFQPLTVAVWHPKGADYEYEQTILNESDIISFHEYGDKEKAEQIIRRLRVYGRPLFCTEWLNRPGGSRFESHLPLWIQENVAAYQWGLFAGKTQTYLHWEKDNNPPDGMPEIWQHDIFHNDGTPYDPEEMAFIRECKRNLAQTVG
jgi:hypothetical protein